VHAGRGPVGVRARLPARVRGPPDAAHHPARHRQHPVQHAAARRAAARAPPGRGRPRRPAALRRTGARPHRLTRPPSGLIMSLTAAPPACRGASIMIDGAPSSWPVLPPSEGSDLSRLARRLAEIKPPARARLVGPDGSTIDLPHELYKVLRDVVSALSQGLAISIAPHNTMLTTQEAADLLNIS